MQTARRVVVARAAAPVKEDWVANLHAGERRTMGSSIG